MESAWETKTERRSGEVDSETEKEYWSGEGEEPEPEAEAEWETTEECRIGEVEPLRHLKHLVGMLLSSNSSTFFRYQSFSPESRYMIASAPQFRQYPEMGGPLTVISSVWGDMATSFGDVKRVCGGC